MSDLPEHITDASFAAHMEAAQLIAAALGQERAEMLDVARALAHAYGEVLALCVAASKPPEDIKAFGDIIEQAAEAMMHCIHETSYAGVA